MDRDRHVPGWLATGSELSLRFLLVVAGLIAVGLIFLELRLVFVPTFVALLVAALTTPPVRRLERRGWPPAVATWAVFLSSLLVLVGVLALLGSQFAGQFEDLSGRVDEGTQEVKDWLADEPFNVSERDLDRYLETAGDSFSSGGSGLASRVAGGVSLAGEVVAGALLALVMAFFFVKDGERITGWALGHLPERQHDVARRAGRRAWSTLTGYIRGTALIGLVDGTIIGIGLAVIGVPLAFPLAAITFFGAFFPLVGATVAGILAALVALVSGGVVDALLVIGVVVIVQQVEGDVLAPVVLGRALRLHPLVILVALTAGAVLAGVLGAFLAVPFAAVATGVASEMGQRSPDGEGESAGEAEP